jgi:hypothetical protein
LGQIAVANREFSTAIAESFMASHQGYSADRVLADPSLNDRFLENCQLLGIPGDPASWNHLLLNIRKHGGLASIDTSRRTALTRTVMDSFIFASEIAWRRVSKDHACSLDEILCDPNLSSRFDRWAAGIAPGYSPFEYRWAALSIRKDASKGNKVLEQVDESFARCVVPVSKLNRLPLSEGHYLITAGAVPFFVGFAGSLRGCPLFNPDRLWPALAAMKHSVSSEKEIEIRSRTFDVAGGRRTGEHIGPVELKAARRAKLLERHEPIANIPLPGPRHEGVTRRCA